MARNTLNTSIAIATHETTLLRISKNAFDECLRESHQKLEDEIMRSLFHNIQKDMTISVRPAALHLLNSAVVFTLQRQQVLYEQDCMSQFVYLIKEGECQTSKKVHIQPQKNDKRQQVIHKPIQLKINRKGAQDLIGDTQILLNKRKRQSTVAATMNSLIVKFDHNTFMKVLSECIDYQKVVMINAKLKSTTANQYYQLKRKKIINKFHDEIQKKDNQRKREMLSKVMVQTANSKTNQIFEVFNQKGIFYRDTFEKLEGFDSYQTSYDLSKSGIKRDRAQVISNQLQETNAVQSRIFKNQQSINKQAQKIRKSTKNTRSHKSKSVHKFKALEKDEEVYKRILIKNGLYKPPKTIGKSCISKPIVHPAFDPIIKQSISRKNLSFRRAMQMNNEEIVKDNYKETVRMLRMKSNSVGNFHQERTTCKGTQQMRKIMSKHKRFHQSASTEKPTTQEVEDQNGTAKQSNLIRNYSQLIETNRKAQQIRQKVILLNHMMKPVIYESQKLRKV